MNPVEHQMFVIIGKMYPLDIASLRGKNQSINRSIDLGEESTHQVPKIDGTEMIAQSRP
jgi:hypothetical protein